VEDVAHSRTGLGPIQSNYPRLGTARGVCSRGSASGARSQPNESRRSSAITSLTGCPSSGWPGGLDTRKSMKPVECTIAPFRCTAKGQNFRSSLDRGTLSGCGPFGIPSNITLDGCCDIGPPAGTGRHSNHHVLEQIVVRGIVPRGEAINSTA
jgi:hypothetical protein